MQSYLYQEGESTVEEELKKLDVIRDRTRASYEEARKALQEANGDVIGAIIAIERAKITFTEELKVQGRDLVDKLKDLIREGNVARLRVKNKDKNHTVIDIPVNGAIILTLFFPVFMALSAVVIYSTDYIIEVERIKPEGAK